MAWICDLVTCEVMYFGWSLACDNYLNITPTAGVPHVINGPGGQRYVDQGHMCSPSRAFLLQ